MEFKSIPPRKDLPYDASKTLQNVEGTLEEFAQFISKFANEEGKEIVFYRENGDAYAYIEEDSTLYLFVSNESLTANKQQFHDTGKVQEVIDKSKLFMNSLIVFFVVLASCLPTI